MLVGTTSIETSEHALRHAEAQRHQTPGAEREASCGGSGDRRQGRTARRGDDRDEHGRPRYRHHLGEGVAELGGLHIIGTERHESRRIDNQLRGRAGRQGDPGSTQFFLRLEDDLMRRFGMENMQNIMARLGFEDDVPIESKMVTRAIEGAQKRVEGHNFDMRKVVLQYDDVINQQRTIIYKQRRDSWRWTTSRYRAGHVG